MEIKTTMNKNTILKAGMLLATVIFTSCAADDAAQGNTAKHDTDLTTQVLTPFATVEKSASPVTRVTLEPQTRTSMDNHQYLTGGEFMWEPGDNIYVKDDAGTLNKDASSTITAKQPTARFQVPGTYAGNSYEVRYTGTAATATADNVTITASQTQAAPNDTKHFGASGDCGTATATRVGDHFEFMLDHKAAYLCFLPLVMNAALAPNVYLTKIVVKSDNAIAGDYTLSLVGLSSAPTANAATEITLTTQGTAHPNGFPMPTATSVATNAAYMVIAPGTHSLTVDYYIKDPVTNVEGTITKTLPVNKNFEANKVYDVTANLTPKDYSDSKYYQWDAQNHYWFGHEGAQTTLNNQADPTNSWPQSNADPDHRWYHEGSVLFEASNSCNGCPNVNELAWYVMKGDPRWDADRLWSFMEHLYKGGMWFMKKNKITGFSTEHTPDGIDLRTADLTLKNTSLAPGLPSASHIGDYFYLPALGLYKNGTLKSIGSAGYYWTSSFNDINSSTNGISYGLDFSNDKAVVDRNFSYYGFRVQSFE